MRENEESKNTGFDILAKNQNKSKTSHSVKDSPSDNEDQLSRSKEFHRWEELNKRAILDITKPEDIPQTCLSIHQNDQTSIIGTLGNISMVLGTAKARKTYLVSAITAAYLTGNTVLNFTGSLPAGKRKVVYADTEQGNFHTRRIFERILRIAHLPTDETPENIKFCRLRSFNYKEIREYLQYEVYNTPGLGLLVIDGVRDLVKDINSSEDAADIARLLMKWSDEQQIHILTVLHQNKGDGNARGHIGSEFSNKAESIIKVEKNNQNKEISTVSSHLVRDLDFTSFSFSIGENDIPQIAEFLNYDIPAKSNPAVHDLQFHKNILTTIFEDVNSAFSFRELISKLMIALPVHYKISDKPAREWINYYLEMELLKNFGNNKKFVIKKNF
jgi:hypothetical protein